MNDARQRTQGVLACTAAYLIWGFIAEYFRILGARGVTPLTLLSHRVVWSMVFCVVMLTLLHSKSDFRNLLLFRSGNRRRFVMLTLSSLMLTVNWLTFIYSIETGRLNESALGYFMTPLISLLLALVVLRERLRPMQWVSLVFAAIGVAIILQGALPWIAISIAVSFGFYGLIRKTTAVAPMTGLAVETAILTPAAIAYILFSWSTGRAPTFTLGTYGLLMLAGVVTAIPLLLFAFAAHRLKLSTIGFLQYIAPTLQLLLAVVVYREHLKTTTLIGFVPIWLGLIVYSTDAGLASRRATRPIATAD